METFAAKLAQTKDTTTLPFYFVMKFCDLPDGPPVIGNAGVFLDVSNLQTDEWLVDVIFRAPIQASELAAFPNRTEITNFLRQRTYGASDSEGTASRQESISSR